MSELLGDVSLNQDQVRLGDVVTEYLTKAIIDGRLKTGDSLPSEGQIASAFGVSKQVARESIRELAALGVVHIQQGKSSRVRAVSPEPLSRFYRFSIVGNGAGLTQAVELRRILEVPIARLAAIRRSPEQMEAIESCLARMPAKLGHPEEWIEIDLEFHQLLAAATGNALLHFQVTGLAPLIREVNQTFSSRRSEIDWNRTLARHDAIVEAVRKGDGEAAAQAMIRHFEAADDAIGEIYPPASRLD